MAKIKLIASDVKNTINELKLYRSGWANDIREGWGISDPYSDQGTSILFTLYEVSGCIILSLEDVLAGRYRDKMALHLVKHKLDQLVDSKEFRVYDSLGEHHICGVVTSGTKHHIRVMMETLEVLIA